MAVAQLIECLLSSRQKSWVRSPVLHKPGVWHMLLISAFGRWRQEHQEVQVMFSYKKIVVSLGWAT